MRTLFTLLFVSLGLTTSAFAEQLMITRQITAFESAAKARRFVELGANAAALETLNRESPDSGGTIKASFALGPKVDLVNTSDASFNVLKIVVYETYDNTASHTRERLPAPARWYTITTADDPA